MKLEYFLTPYTKINSKWIKDLNVRPETMKLLEDNLGKTLSDINHSRILYDPPPRILEIKAKVNTLQSAQRPTANSRKLAEYYPGPLAYPYRNYPSIHHQK